MKRILVFLVCFPLVTGITFGQEKQSDELLSNAIYQEEVKGNLEGAILIYKDIIKKYPGQRAIAAEALFHLGLSNEKLGNKIAKEYYEQVVSNYGDQPEFVKIARERLARLKPVISPAEIAIKQVWAGSGVDQLGSVSPDGEYLTFVDWTTGNLAIRNFRTGENKPLTNDGSWKEPRQYALFSLISPDATQVVYLWYNAVGITDLRLIKVGNPSPVILFTPANKDESMVPGAWFSDGRMIIVQMYNGNSKIWKLLSINVITREIQVLKEKQPGPAHLSRLSLSPDEKQIAFDFPNPEDKDLYDIYLLSIDSKDETLLVKHPADDRLIGWLPGQNKLLFTSNRTGTTDVWAVNPLNVKSFDVSERILTNVGEINPMGFTLDGSLYYGVQSHIFESFILPLDSTTGKLSDSPKKIFSAPVFDICWLSDGETLICRQFDKYWNFTLGIYNSTTGMGKTLSENIIAYGSVRISSDEKSVLIYGNNKNADKTGVYSVDIKTGLTAELMKFDPDDQNSNNVEWDKEGKNIFYTRNNRIIKHSIENGEEKILYTDKNAFFNPSLRRSLDGKYLFFDGMINLNETENIEEETQLLSIPVEGGEAKVLCTAAFPSGGMYKRISISPDGKYIYFSAKTPVIKSVLFRIPFEGGEPEIVWQSKDYNIAGISIHPDGRQIALSTSVSQVEIRAIENLGR